MKTYINPESLVRNPAFTQAVVVEGAAKTIYVGGQNAVRPDGAVVGGTLAEGFAAFREAWGNAGDPPTISVHIVSGLANPRFLVEIDAVAVV